MRLTLRTLLLYLDDILEPAQTKEIGQKIVGSNFATSLISRIREVMRRRRLTAPEVNTPGAGLNPNTVAEYLDYTLPPDGVADVEKVCLDSDVHLAEVAACHQVLTLVLGEPVEVLPKSRERMYALGPVPKSSMLDVETSEPPAAEAPAPVKQVQKQKPAPKAKPRRSKRKPAQPFSATVPEFLKPAPFWRRAIPYTVVLIGVAVFLALIAGDPAFFSGRNEPSDGSVNNNGTLDADKQLAAADTSQQSDVDLADIAGRQTEPAVEDNDVVIPESTNILEQPRIDPLPPADVPDSVILTVGSNPPATLTIPDGVKSTLTGVERPKEPTTVANVTPKKVEAPGAGVAANVVSMQYQSIEGLLLRYDEQQADWFAVPRRGLVRPDERIAAVEPMDAMLAVGGGRLHITVLGGTSARILGASRAAPFGVAIERGRVVLQSRPGGEENSGIALSAVVGNELWRVELMTPETVCGLEIVPTLPNHFEQDLGTAAYSGVLYVRKGSVKFADGAHPIRVVDAGGRLVLDRKNRAAIAAGKQITPIAGVSRPEWIDPDSRRISATQRRSATLFEKEFDVEEGVLFNVPAMVKDPRPRISELAVKCLSLTRQYGSLVKALAQAEHEEARMAAIIGLRTWLPESPQNAESLKDELKNVFHAEEAEALYRLLWGFNAEDARDEETSLQLVKWLGHNHVTVRELAFHHIVKLTGRKNDYGPLRSMAQRRTAIARWVEHVNREGALVGE